MSELRQFRHFVALAESRNFQRAADTVGLSQSAFSRSIQMLERNLGCILVDRGSREFSLTAQGELVLQHARRLLAASRSLRNELDQFEGLTAGELRFASGPFPAQRLIPEALAAFVAAHPAIRVAFQVEDWGQAAQHLQEEQIEFFVGDARGFSSDENYRVQLLGYRGGCFFCRQGHPLTALPQIRLADLLGYPRIGVRLPDVARKILAEIAGQADFQMDVECAQFDVALRVVSSSDGTGMAPLEAVAEPIRRGELVRLRIADMPPAEAALRLQYGIVSRAGYSLSPAARTMIEVLVATDRRLLTQDAG